jgi:hypothetical protein
MSKLTDIAAGDRAIKRIVLPLVNVPCSLLPDIPELMEQRKKDAEAAASQGAPVVPATVEVGLRVLTGAENLLIERLTNKMAEANGCKAFDESDAIFNMAKSLYTIAVACVDPDSDAKDPDLFFSPLGTVVRASKAGALVPGEKDRTFADECVQTIQLSTHVGRDGIIYLAEQHEFWQDTCNASALKMSEAQMWAHVGEVAASSDARPFLSLRPGMRWIFARSMAVLLWNSYLDKSSSGRTSQEDLKANELS